MELLDVERPPVAPDGVLVRVRAAGLNPVDHKVREGKLADKFPYRFPVILGWDVAGEVEEVGPAVTWFKPGDPVYGYNRRHEQPRAKPVRTPDCQGFGATSLCYCLDSSVAGAPLA